MSNSSRDPFDKVAEEFLERYRRGERPAVSEYAENHPELAEEIRDLFPALVEMEELRPPKTDGFAAPAEPQSHAETPTQLGEYQILREVGRGGMGIVYEAVQVSLGRHVALKVLPYHRLLKETHLERFRREARAAARLHHTNIVPVFGVGEHEGIHYYAMQFIHGQALSEVLKELRRLRNDRDANKKGPTQELAASVAQGLLTGQFPARDAAWSPPVAQWEKPPPAPASGGSSGGGSHSDWTSQSEVHYFHSVAQMGVQVADALEHAHQQGVLHRDIKARRNCRARCRNTTASATSRRLPRRCSRDERQEAGILWCLAAAVFCPSAKSKDRKRSRPRSNRWPCCTASSPLHLSM